MRLGRSAKPPVPLEVLVEGSPRPRARLRASSRDIRRRLHRLIPRRLHRHRLVQLAEVPPLVLARNRGIERVSGAIRDGSAGPLGALRGIARSSSRAEESAVSGLDALVRGAFVLRAVRVGGSRAAVRALDVRVDVFLGPPVLLTPGLGGVGDAAEAGPRGMKRRIRARELLREGDGAAGVVPAAERRAERGVELGRAHHHRVRVQRELVLPLESGVRRVVARAVDRLAERILPGSPLGRERRASARGDHRLVEARLPLHRVAPERPAGTAVRHRGRPRAAATRDAGLRRRETPAAFVDCFPSTIRKRGRESFGVPRANKFEGRGQPPVPISVCIS